MAVTGGSGSVLPQYLAAIAANLANMCCGTALGWSSPAGPQLLTWMSPQTAAWAASLLPLFAALGPAIGGALTATLGPRRALLAAGLPFLPAWLATAWAAHHRSAIWLCASRALAGSALGAVFTALPVYVTDIAQDEVRGTLGALMQAFITTGLLVEYCVGPFTTAEQLSLVSAAAPVLFALAMVMLAPESPMYLLSKGRWEDAEVALMRLRGHPADGVKEELQKMEICLKETAEEDSSEGGPRCSVVAVRAILLSLALVTFQQLSGINCVLFFGTQLLNMAAKGAAITSAQGNAIMGVLMLLASFCTPALAFRFGRKTLLTLSAAGMAASQLVLGLYCYHREDPGWQYVNWLPVLCLVIYIVVFTFGFGPLPWTVMAELLPPAVKSYASAATASFCWLLAFLVTRFFSDMVSALDVEGTFWLFAGWSLAAAVFIVTVLPETKGKSLHQIQLMLAGRTNLQDEP